MPRDLSATAPVLVTGVKAGDPPLLGVRILGKRSLVRWLPVYDKELFEKLQARAHPGDMIRIRTFTALKEGEGRLVTYLTDFSLLPGEK